MRGINCTALWIKALYKCSPFTYITPLLKKPTLDPSTIHNYRPVSLHPFINKTLERAASNQLSAVNQSILLSSLAATGICGTALDWIKSYLSGCSSQVTWAGNVSAPHPLITGVPQGSVLGPLLFSMYTRSLGPIISAPSMPYDC